MACPFTVNRVLAKTARGPATALLTLTGTYGARQPHNAPSEGLWVPTMP